MIITKLHLRKIVQPIDHLGRNLYFYDMIENFIIKVRKKNLNSDKFSGFQIQVVYLKIESAQYTRIQSCTNNTQD